MTDKDQSDAELEAELLKTVGTTKPAASEDDEDGVSTPVSEDDPAAIVDVAVDVASEKENVEPADTTTSGTGGDNDAKPDDGKIVQPTDAGGTGSGVAVPAKPKPVAEKPKQEFKTDPHIAQLKAIEAKIQAEDFDPYSKDGKQAYLDHANLAAQVQANYVASAAASWEIAEDEHGIPARQLQKMWRDARDEVRQELGRDSEDAATILWKQKVAAAKNKIPAKVVSGNKPTVAPTPITASGGRTVPPAARAVPPQPKEDMSDEDELVSKVSKRMAVVPGQRR